MRNARVPVPGPIAEGGVEGGVPGGVGVSLHCKLETCCRYANLCADADASLSATRLSRPRGAFLLECQLPRRRMKSTLCPDLHTQE